MRQRVPPFTIRPTYQRLRRITAVLFACLLTTSTFAQAPAAGTNWDRLKALPLQTRLHVSADKDSSTCKIVSVDEASLVCGKRTYARSEIKRVKLTRYAGSYTAGAAIGAGVGIAFGLGLSEATNDGFFKNNKASFAGGGAVLGAVIGTLITGPADLFRGPTIYRRP